MTIQQERQWTALVDEADRAGLAAFLDPGPSAYGLGVAGYSWIRVKPATGAFARWLVRTGRANRDDYAGGIAVMSAELVEPERVPTIEPVQAQQSAVRHAAYARAFAAVLANQGVPAFAEDHLD